MRTNNTSLLIGVLLFGVLLVGTGHLWLKNREQEVVLTAPAGEEVVTEQPTEPQEPAETSGAELAYIDQVVHTLSSWDTESLKPMLSPQTLAGSSDDQLKQVLETLESRLGALRSYSPPAAEQRVPVVGEPGNLSAYRLVAYFDKGAADMSLVLQEDDNVHHLYAFNVEIPQQL